jgi:hypothetical protein
LLSSARKTSARWKLGTRPHQIIDRLPPWGALAAGLGGALAWALLLFGGVARYRLTGESLGD